MVSGAHKFGIAVAVILLVGLNLPTLSSWASESRQPSQIPMQMCAPSNSPPVKTNVASDEYANFTGVPDYNARIFVNMKSTYYPGNAVQIRLDINDTGITRMKNPYFYLLVFNPLGELEAMSPCNSYQPSQTYFSAAAGTKWQDQTPSGNCQTGYVEVAGVCEVTPAFISGQLGNQPIVYSFTADKPGVWQVYVFVFDTTYLARSDVNYCIGQYDYVLGQSCSPSFFQNAVNATTASFDVLSGTPQTIGISPLSAASYALTFLVAGVGYFVSGSERVYPLVIRTWPRIRGFVRELVIFLVLVTIYSIILIRYIL